MCGIFAVFNMKGDYTFNRRNVTTMIKRLIHRGPDSTGLTHYQIGENVHHFIGHQRLSIVDPFKGDQPFWNESKNICTVTNGEIYNHMALRQILKKQHTYKGHSDCEVIPFLYEEMSVETIANSLLGKYGVVIYDHNKNRFYVIRDPLGVIPVYMGRGQNGEFFVSSELKAFHDFATTIEILLPGKIAFKSRSLL